MEKELQLVMSYLDGIASKLGIGMETIWPWLVRQQYVEAIYSLAWLVGISAIMFVTSKFVVNHWHSKEGNTYSIYKEDHEVFWCMPLLMLGVLFIGALIMFGIEFIDVFNPEYAALKDIIFMTK